MAVVIAEVSFSPIGTATPSLSTYVAAALRVLKEHPELKYQLNPMGTVLEGERADIIGVIEEMNEAIFAAGALRVGTTLKIDERRDKPASMEHKVETVMEQLGHPSREG
ncbi:MAG TPA: MTH1187 family thiamine-binding protein [Chloroflexia bacterium]|nr:MTH1187 family thiamine-binding protein [Chloroflexia bacterium]